MNRNIYNAIKNEYESRQKAAFDRLMQRKAEVYSKIPRIEEIDGAIQLAGVKYNKMILLGTESSETAIDKLKNEIDSLKSEKDLLLMKFSYPSDYLELKFQCILCKDTGFIDTPGGTEKCSCFKQQYINQLFNQSNLNLVKLENFLYFNENYYPGIIDEAKYGIKVSPRENIMRIKEKAEGFIENFDKTGQKSLFFSGPTGVGKTFMINCIASELLERGRTVLYQTASSLFKVINEHKFNKDDGYEDTSYNDIFNIELLIIDDLGTESPSAARYAELLNILNIRQENDLVRPCKTIISTNIGINKLHEYYDERVASRIIGGFDLFRFSGEDIRMIKKISADSLK